MHVFFEESGDFKAEKIFSRAETSLQTETETGRRRKIRASNVLFEFDSPAPAQLLQEAKSMADDIDTDFLWECAPQEDIDAIEFAEEYFGHKPNAIEKAALIMAIHSAPAYFHRRGKGRYKPAPPDILKAALAAIEKKEQEAKQQQQWIDSIKQGVMPPEIAEVAESFLIKPDKNTLQWKAFEAAVKELQTTPEKLLLDLKVWPHALALHQYRFMSAHYPKGTGFPDIELPDIKASWPKAEVTAYTLDDSQTTEFDDALSVSLIDENTVRVGVHIAAPALAVQRGSQLDELARKRMSTLYTPGFKVPMLPDEIINEFSLVAGKTKPAVSLYVEANLETGEIKSTETRLESITVKANLFHRDLRDQATQEALENENEPLQYGEWLRPLWRFSRILSAKREEVRGKPENNNRVEYLFELEGPHTDPNSRITLIARPRNAPLDKMVAEYMIMANNLWGGLLNDSGLPGIYRSQQAMRTRMTTHALPHETIGVDQYAWSTSPLRRYVDLINQSQIIAAAEHGVTARLVAPFQPKDADLYAIIGAFDAQYSALGAYQQQMERYWVLRWLQQEACKTVSGSIIRDDLVRLDNAPLVVKVPGVPELERGDKVLIDILGFNELDLELESRFNSVINE